MENTEREYKYVTVEYMIDPRQQKALEELLPCFQNYSGTEGSRPFQNWTIDDVFKSIMLNGSKFVIADKIQNMQIMQGLIKWEDKVENDFRTMEERRMLEISKESVINKLRDNKEKIELEKSRDVDKEYIEIQNEQVV